jgi:hypothetical protein
VTERYVEPEELEAAQHAAQRSLARIEDPDARDDRIAGAAELAGRRVANDLRDLEFLAGEDEQIADDLDRAVAACQERFALYIYEGLAEDS